MKSAEEIVADWRHNPKLNQWRYDEFPLADLIRAIQRDALLEAAEIAHQIAHRTDSINCGRIHQAILERSRGIE